MSVPWRLSLGRKNPFILLLQCAVTKGCDCSDVYSYEQNFRLSTYHKDCSSFGSRKILKGTTFKETFQNLPEQQRKEENRRGLR